MRQIGFFCISVAVAALPTAAPLAARNLPGSTSFSLTQSVRIPGATLKPGNYVIRVLDKLPDRYILEVTAAKERKATAVFLAIPEAALPKAAAGEPVYWPDSGTERSMRGMWLHGQPHGAQFVFPKAEAASLAKNVNMAVPAIDPDSEHKPALPEMSGSDRQIVTLWLLSTKSITPDDGSEKQLQAEKYKAPVLLASAKMPRRAVSARLPKTATNSASLILAGFLCAALGLGLLAGRNRWGIARR